VPPVTAIQMGTINTARHYRLRNHGAIAPRYWADFVVLDDLEKFVIRRVYKKGKLVAQEGEYRGPEVAAVKQPRNTINIRFRGAEDIAVKADGAKNIKVIEIVPEQIITNAVIFPPRIEDGEVLSDTSRDLLKLVVVERHKATGNVGVGFVRGFQLQRGALGSTVAHDAHNVVVVGVDDSDIIAAVSALQKMGGGQVAIDDGQETAALPLPIAGLVSDRPLPDVVEKIEALKAAAAQLGCSLPAPFMSLSFLSLSPIPALKLTDQGLVDAVNMKLTGLFTD
jgi:adenine deaminase